MRKFDNVRKKEITFENKVNVPPLQRVGKKTLDYIRITE
jgi:hypothetical protein